MHVFDCNDEDNDSFLIDEKEESRLIRKFHDYTSLEKQIAKIQLDIDLMNQFSDMFENNLSTEINTSSVKNISLLTSIFYGESLTSKMIQQLQEDVIKRDELLLKDFQTKVLRYKGISRINTKNIYHINNKSDIIIQIYLDL